MPTSPRVRARVAKVLAAILALPVVLLVALNLFLNLGLTPLINKRPERMQITFTYAWMVVPGQVNVHGLVIQGTGRTDAWKLTADHVTGLIDVEALQSRILRASNVEGTGVEFLYGPRPDPEEAPRVPKGKPWVVEIDGVQLEDVRHVAFADYHVNGVARIPNATLAIHGPVMDIDGTLEMTDMTATHLADPLATHIRGAIQVTLDGLDRKANLGRAFFDTLSARAAIDADVGSLGFLDYYLEKAQWLELKGGGGLHADVVMDRGEVLAGSVVTAEVPGMVVGFLGWEVAGDARVQVDVGADPAVPGSKLALTFSDYSVTGTGGGSALVKGEGFMITAVTPDTSFKEPFTSFDVVFELPTSQIPSFSPYSALLPQDVGMKVAGGSGTVSGKVFASTTDNSARGELVVNGSGVTLQLGEVTIVSSVEAHAKLKHGNLASGVYDISGTSIDLKDVSIETPNQPDAGTTGWYAALALPEAAVRVGADTFFEADILLRCLDSAPFLTMFAEKRALPDWARKLLTIRDIQGQAHLALGTEKVEITSAAFHGSTYEVLMHIRREHALNYGALFARLGPLSIGVGVDGRAKHIQVVGARQWYEQGGEADDYGSAKARARKEERLATPERQAKLAEKAVEKAEKRAEKLEEQRDRNQKRDRRANDR